MTKAWPGVALERSCNRLLGSWKLKGEFSTRVRYQADGAVIICFEPTARNFGVIIGVQPCALSLPSRFVIPFCRYAHISYWPAVDLLDRSFLTLFSARLYDVWIKGWKLPGWSRRCQAMVLTRLKFD